MPFEFGITMNENEGMASHYATLLSQRALSK